MDGWIVIPNWSRFQHYKDRNPSWIKVYTELNSRAEWLSLTWQQRGVLVTIWAEFARAHGTVRVSDVSRLCHQPLRTRHLEALIDAGFIEVSASRPASTVASPHALAREEVLRTKEKEATKAVPLARTAGPSPQEQLLAAACSFVANWRGGSSDAFDAGLDELEEIIGAHLQAGDRYRLWDQALAASNGRRE